MKRTLSILLSAVLATSLFAFPAMSYAEDGNDNIVLEQGEQDLEEVIEDEPETVVEEGDVFDDTTESSDASSSSSSASSNNSSASSSASSSAESSSTSSSSSSSSAASAFVPDPDELGPWPLDSVFRTEETGESGNDNQTTAPVEKRGATIQVKLISYIHPTIEDLNKADLHVGLYNTDGSTLFTPQRFSERAKPDADSDSLNVRAGEYIVTFPDRIPAGERVIKVYGKNYVDYTHTVTVGNGDLVTISLVDESPYNNSDNSTNVDGSIHGLIPYGDFNEDNQINQADVDLLTEEVVKAEAGEATDLKFDINADKRVDLVDLQRFATLLPPQAASAAANSQLVTTRTASVSKQKDLTLTNISTAGNTTLRLSSAHNDSILDPNDYDSPEQRKAMLQKALFGGSDSTVLLGNSGNAVISEENPVELDIDVQQDRDESNDGIAQTSVLYTQAICINVPQQNTLISDVGSPSSGKVIAVMDNNEEVPVSFDRNEAVFYPASIFTQLVSLFVPEEAHAVTQAESKTNAELTAKASAVIEKDGTIVVDFGERIPIKKIKIQVTGTTTSNAKLTEIAKVKFLNDMADRITPPDLSVPANVKATAGKNQFTVTWNQQHNITGYEVYVTCADHNASVIYSALMPTYTVKSFDGKDKLHAGNYKVKIRSVNGDWYSPWSEIVQVNIKPLAPPDKPTNVVVTSNYAELLVKWPAVEDANSYALSYREDGTSTYSTIEGITKTTYALTGLKPSTKYQLFLVAKNDAGSSRQSDVYEGTTLGSASVKVPWYNLINRAAQYPNDETLNNHIESVSYTIANNDTVNPNMSDMAVVDGDYLTTYIPSRRSSYYDGPIVTFDHEYNINNFIVTTQMGSTYGVNSSQIWEIQVKATDAAGNKVEYRGGNSNSSIRGATWTSAGSNAPNSISVNIPTTKVKTIQVGIVTYTYSTVGYAEIAFYEDDGLETDIAGLWEDELHTVLKPNVTEETISALETRVNTSDPQTRKSPEDNSSGEFAPKRSTYLTELNSAKTVFENQELMREPMHFDSSIDVSVNNNVSGLNGWQPLGISAAKDDDICVYVSGKRTNSSSLYTPGSGTALRLSIAQYGGETKAVNTKLADLKIGMNKVKVGQLTSQAVENGGPLYVEYLSSTKNVEYSVRVIGGTDIPRLDVRGTQGEEREQLCKEYLEKLEQHVISLSTIHRDTEHHTGDYEATKCPANTTDIVMDGMMYSIPATQAKAGIGAGGTIDDRAKALAQSLTACEEVVALYYQHKGLGNLTSDEVAKYGNNNGIPKGHLNIRYMQMNPGVFMYAAGNHIGVQYAQSGVTWIRGVNATEDGKWQSGSYFGWGIAHEIGHQINENKYAYAEVTNNYFPQLTTVNENNNSSRYSYDSLYDRVTSGAKGAPTGKVGIGIYWQLHLAYDNGYNYKTYNNYTDQFDNLFFARVDSYARNTTKAPQPGGVPLVVTGTDKDNVFMRLSCAAAQKNLLNYFEAWGLTPNDATREYAEQFEREERLIQYINDDARVKRIKGAQAVASDVQVSADMFVNDAKVEESKVVNSRQIKLQITQEGAVTDDLIGYEILRNGKPVAFKMIGNQDKNGTLTYIDTIATENNRVYEYEVRAVDNLLGHSSSIKLPAVKVHDDGTMADKSTWTTLTNMVSKTASKAVANMDDAMPCEQEEAESAANAVIDGKATTAFDGVLPETATNSAGEAVQLGAPYITIGLGGNKQIVAIKIPATDEATINACKIELSTNGETWAETPKGTVINNDGAITIYLDRENDRQLHIYDAAYIRFTTTNANATGFKLHEVDVLGHVGDNADFLTSEEGVAVGKLSSDIRLQGDDEVIPAGSLIFMGSLSGDIAYNAIKLIDQDGNIVPGTQVLFADEPGEGRNLGVTANGRWIYYITPDEMNPETGFAMPTSVHAQLYRVNDAFTLVGERLVSDTLTVSFDYAELPSVTLSFSGGQPGTSQTNPPTEEPPGEQTGGGDEQTGEQTDDQTGDQTGDQAEQEQPSEETPEPTDVPSADITQEENSEE